MNAMSTEREVIDALKKILNSPLLQKERKDNFSEGLRQLDIVRIKEILIRNKVE